MGRKSKNGTQIERAIELIIKKDYITWPLISRKIRIGYLGAQKIIKQLEEMGYIEKIETTSKKVLKHYFLN